MTKSDGIHFDAVEYRPRFRYRVQAERFALRASILPGFLWSSVSPIEHGGPNGWSKCSIYFDADVPLSEEYWGFGRPYPCGVAPHHLVRDPEYDNRIWPNQWKGEEEEALLEKQKVEVKERAELARLKRKYERPSLPFG